MGRASSEIYSLTGLLLLDFSASRRRIYGFIQFFPECLGICFVQLWINLLYGMETYDKMK